MGAAKLIAELERELKEREEAERKAPDRGKLQERPVESQRPRYNQD
jgi:hypothetical protein